MKKYLYIVLLVGVCFGQNNPPYSGTIFIDGDIITENDSSTFVSAPYSGQGMRTMFDRRENNWITVNAYLFDASYNDGLSCEIQVNPEFETIDNALIEAEKYGKEIGRLPTCLRVDVETVWIHQGTEPFGGGNNNILIHTGQAINYINSDILEETLVHEASHTSLDSYHSYSTGWLNAQAQDNHFISTYAQDYPEQEDIAESFLVYLAIQYRPDRISDDTYQTIVQTIPNRIEYFNSQGFDMYPIVIEDYSGPIWHVATTGSDETGDGSEQNPFATIEKAEQLANQYYDESYENILFNTVGQSRMPGWNVTDTILVHAGTYHIGELRNGSNDYDGDLVTIIKSVSGPDSTFLNPINEYSHIGATQASYDISGFTISELQLFYYASFIYLNNCIIKKMSDIEGSSCGLGSYCYGFENVTFVQNNNYESYDFNGSPLFYNSIIFDNENFLEDALNNQDTGIRFTLNDIGLTADGNIYTDPLFCNPENEDFLLAANSPAIGAGENGVNMGASGIGCEAIELSIDKTVIPDLYLLHQNYPNPFNPATKISYDLPEASAVGLSIYDLMGRKVRTLINYGQTAGLKNIQWDATNDLGQSVSAGMYIYTIQAGEFRQTKKMVLLK